jgi:hypothetical protein
LRGAARCSLYLPFSLLYRTSVRTALTPLSSMVLLSDRLLFSFTFVLVALDFS